MKAFSYALLIGSLVAGDLAAQSWCAKSRSPEPLLSEGKALAGSSDPRDARVRGALALERSFADSVRIITDETVCKAAARSYWSILRASVPDIFGSHPDGPVLVVRLGQGYLVDDLRDRKTYWEVMVFSGEWRRVHGYGGGS